MFADVWSKRDFVAAGAVLVGVALAALGQAFHSGVLLAAGPFVVLAAAAVLVVWRDVGAAGPSRDVRRQHVERVVAHISSNRNAAIAFRRVFP